MKSSASRIAEALFWVYLSNRTRLRSPAWISKESRIGETASRTTAPCSLCFLYTRIDDSDLSKAAIGLDVSSGDVARSVGCEERNNAPHLFGLAHTCQWNDSNDICHVCFPCFWICQRVFQQRGRDRPRRKHIDADLAELQFVRPGSGKAPYRCLGRGID
jgi:hypothetical protein